MTFLVPHTVTEALHMAQEAGTSLLAGGTDLFAMPDDPKRTMLDLTRIPELRGISRDGDTWRFGATTTWSDIARADLPSGFTALQQAAREVGAVQIQNAGTIAGNLCNASPAADGVPPLISLDAEVEIAAPNGVRRMPVARFLTGVRQTALKPGEIVTAILIPTPPAEMYSAFLKLGTRGTLVISIAMVAACLRLEDERVAEARLALGACSAIAQRLPALEAALVGVEAAKLSDWTIDPAQHLAPLKPIDDVRGSAAYRLQAVAVLCRRALVQAAKAGTDE